VFTFCAVTDCPAHLHACRALSRYSLTRFRNITYARPLSAGLPQCINEACTFLHFDREGVPFAQHDFPNSAAASSVGTRNTATNSGSPFSTTAANRYGSDAWRAELAC